MKGNASPQKKCLICLDTYTEKDIQTITYGCGHKFHSLCLFGWLDVTGRNDNTTRCPQCRQKVITWPGEKAQPQVSLLRYWSRVFTYYMIIIVIALLVVFPVNYLSMLPVSSSQLSPPPHNVSLMTFIHSICHDYYPCLPLNDIGYDYLFKSITICQYNLLYVIHLLDTFYRVIDCMIHCEKMVIDTMFMLVIDEPVFIWSLHNNKSLNTLVDTQALIWHHTNKHGDTPVRRAIENIAVSFLYVGYSVTVILVNQFVRTMNLYDMEVTILVGWQPSSIVVMWREWYECFKHGHCVLNLCALEGHPQLIYYALIGVMFFLLLPYMHFISGVVQ